MGTLGRAVVALATGVLLLAPVLVGQSAWAASGFPCEDVNGDGQCGDGDRDLSADFASGFVFTSGDIVIPEDMKGMVLRNDLALFTSGSVAVHGKLQASSIQIGADGALTVHRGGGLRADDSIDLSITGDVAMGPQASLTVRNGSIHVTSWNGSVHLVKSKIGGPDGVDVAAYGGSLTITDSQLSATSGEVRLHGAGDVVVAATTLMGSGHLVRTDSSLVDFRGNHVRVTSRDGWVYIAAAGSTINVKGTKFKNVAPENVFLDAENVVQ
jgi:hypothetical protein